MRAHGQVRRGQFITTYGPSALRDLPRPSAIVGGLDTWPKVGDLEEILEPRLKRKLQFMTGVVIPRLYAPPPDTNAPGQTAKGIGVWRFPEWFVVRIYAANRSIGRGVAPKSCHRDCHRTHQYEVGRFGTIGGLPLSKRRRSATLRDDGRGTGMARRELLNRYTVNPVSWVRIPSPPPPP